MEKSMLSVGPRRKGRPACVSVELSVRVVFKGCDVLYTVFLTAVRHHQPQLNKYKRANKSNATPLKNRTYTYVRNPSCSLQCNIWEQ